MAWGGMLVLVNDCLTNIPMFIMGFYLLQEGVHDKLDRVRSNSLKWDAIYSPK